MRSPSQTASGATTRVEARNMIQCGTADPRTANSAMVPATTRTMTATPAAITRTSRREAPLALRYARRIVRCTSFGRAAGHVARHRPLAPAVAASALRGSSVSTTLSRRGRGMFDIAGMSRSFGSLPKHMRSIRMAPTPSIMEWCVFTYRAKRSFSTPSMMCASQSGRSR